MNSQRREELSVAEQAASWLQDLETAGRHENAAFLKWLRASPLHVQEFLVAGRVQEVLRNIDPERRIDVAELAARARAASNVLPIDAHAASGSRVAGARWRVRWIAAVAASMAAISLLAWLVFSHFDGQTLYATQRGEQRMLKLDDGSVIFLNTQSQIRVRYGATERNIDLQRGQALFQVQHDASRPFRVHAAAAVIQALGTQFDVRLDVNRTTVAVVEGAVQIFAPKSEREPARITAGEGAIVGPSGQIKREATMDSKTVTAWRQQRLIFRNTPLNEIASEFNRYNAAPRLLVEGDTLRARRFDGSFNALRPESFLKYLAEEQGLNFERRADEVVIRER